MTLDDFEVRVQVGGLCSVVGKLPATPWRPIGGIYLSETLDRHMRPAEARALADTITQVADALDAEADRRYP